MGKVMRFVPDGYLPADTDFTVSVATGYTVEGYTLDEYSFSFSTKSQPEVSRGQSPAYGGMLYFTPEEEVFLYRNESTASEKEIKEILEKMEKREKEEME